MREARFAFKCVVPVMLSYVFMGMASGIMLADIGYSPFWALGAGIFVYSGSMQIVMVQLLQNGVGLATVALMTLFINARHVFYGIAFIDRFKRAGGWKYIYMMLTLTDEAYSVLCSVTIPKELNETRTTLDILFFCHATWASSCFIGAVAGNLIPFDMSGIEFSATALFMAIVVDQWRQCRSHIPAIAGGVSAIIFLIILGPDNFILPALSVSVIALMLLRTKIEPVVGRKE